MKLDRRTAILGLAAGLSAPWLSRSAEAAAPPKRAQLPGAQRLKVGSLEVTAILDGHFDLDPKLIPKAQPEEVERLLQAAFLPGSQPRTAINAYVVNTGQRLVLVDSGCADLFGPNGGRLPGNLAAAGIDPATIDTVLLTHMHPDHVGGILAPAGDRAFANAELIVHDTEWKFWTDDAVMAQAAEQVRPFFTAARNATTPYADRLRRFLGEVEVLPGIWALPLPGHTPGHTGYALSSEGQSLLIWGDLVHVASLQLAHPDWSMVFDVDPDMAAATRARALDRVATDRLAIAGMHMPFPGVGHIARAGAAYELVPAPWSYEL